jgi:hypothetical protein
MKHVEMMASEPHRVGSPELKEVRDYIIHELTVMGLKPELQKGHSENDSAGYADQ